MAGLAEEQDQRLLRLPAVHPLLPQFRKDDDSGGDDVVADPSEPPAAGDLEIDGDPPPPAGSRRHADERLVASVPSNGPRAFLGTQRVESGQRRRPPTVPP